MNPIMLQNAIIWLLDTASSPPFWKALIGFAMAVGINISPDQSNAIISGGVALIAVVQACQHVTRDKPDDKTKPPAP